MTKAESPLVTERSPPRLAKPAIAPMSHRCISGPAIVVTTHSGFDTAGALNHFRAQIRTAAVLRVAGPPFRAGSAL